MAKNMLGMTLREAGGPLGDLTEKLASDRGQLWLRELKKFLRQDPTFSSPPMELQNQLHRWQRLFDDSGINFDVSKIDVPKSQPEFNRLIVVPLGLSSDHLVKIMQKRFDVWLYTNGHKKLITKDDRSNSNSAYAIWVRDRVEADTECMNVSADEASQQGIVGVTLIERLLHELMFFYETGENLDLQNVTICTGSRFAGNTVPRVYWRTSDSRVSVNSLSTDYSSSNIRARVAVF